MNSLLRLILFIFLVVAGQSYATTTAMSYGYVANAVQLGVENINNNGLINPSGCCSKLSFRDSQDRVQARAFFVSSVGLDVPNRGATISSPLADGQPGAIYKGFGDLNKRQQGLLDQLGSPGQTTIIPKNGISQKDLAALTAKTGDEFAVFTVGGRRMVVRGGSNGFDGIINEAWAAEKAAQGWRFSAHTHPVPNGVEPGAVLRSSGGDQAHCCPT